MNVLYTLSVSSALNMSAISNVETVNSSHQPYVSVVNITMNIVITAMDITIDIAVSIDNVYFIPLLLIDTVVVDHVSFYIKCFFIAFCLCCGA